ncbi:MAG: serine/threonine-protein kinase [Candidatus Xenobia bacterium]
MKAPLPAGHVLFSRFRIVEMVGRGSMGVVYRAVPVDGGTPVAVKELMAAVSGPEVEAAFVEQFHIEGRILESLQHPGLPRVLQLGEEAGRHFLIMEFVPGRTLEAECEARQPAALRVLRWGAEVCDVLAYLHRHEPPVIFRDLKPANVMLGEDGHVRLLDFGIAKLFDAVPGVRTPVVARGAFTPGFAAPEQYRADPTDARTDIYGLGATLYFALTGAVPPQAIQRMQGRADLQFPPGCPARMVEIVGRMMAITPASRFATAEEARDAMLQVLDESPRPARPAWPLALLAAVALTASIWLMLHFL